jgi:hypothetical protein
MSTDTQKSSPETINARLPQTGFFDSAEARLMDMAEDTKAGLVKSMDGLVLAAHRIAADIESVAGSSVGDLARSAADLLGAIQSGLDAKPLAELLEDGQDLIRRQPALAIGVAVASGFVLARIAKSSGPKVDETP